MNQETLDHSTPEQLLAHLKACDAGFVPPLSHRVSLSDYAAKLCARAHRFEIWQDGQLAGVVALYADNAEAGGFISNVSVLPACQGQGLAKRLMHQAMQWASAHKLPSLRLEVGADNLPALSLYQQLGFQPQSREGSSLFLIRSIP